jgi:integrase
MEDNAPAPSAMEQGEFERLLQAAAHSALPCRDRAILRLIWEAGLRPREVTLLEPDDIDFPAGAVTRGDGRRVAVSRETVHLLTAYASIERDGRCPRLFSGRHGRPLRAADLDRLFRWLSRQSGVPADPLGVRRAAMLRALRAEPREFVARWRRAGHGPCP